MAEEEEAKEQETYHSEGPESSSSESGQEKSGEPPAKGKKDSITFKNPFSFLRKKRHESEMHEDENKGNEWKFGIAFLVLILLLPFGIEYTIIGLILSFLAMYKWGHGF